MRGYKLQRSHFDGFLKENPAVRSYIENAYGGCETSLYKDMRKLHRHALKKDEEVKRTSPFITIGLLVLPIPFIAIGATVPLLWSIVSTAVVSAIVIPYSLKEHRDALKYASDPKMNDLFNRVKGKAFYLQDYVDKRDALLSTFSAKERVALTEKHNLNITASRLIKK